LLFSIECRLIVWKRASYCKVIQMTKWVSRHCPRCEWFRLNIVKNRLSWRVIRRYCRINCWNYFIWYQTTVFKSEKPIKSFVLLVPLRKNSESSLINWIAVATIAFLISVHRTDIMIGKFINWNQIKYIIVVYIRCWN
jgi:hypothetical protein